MSNTTTTTTKQEEKKIFIEDFLDLCRISDNGSRRYYIRHFKDGEKKTIKEWENITKLKFDQQ